MRERLVSLGLPPFAPPPFASSFPSDLTTIFTDFCGRPSASVPCCPRRDLNAMLHASTVLNSMYADVVLDESRGVSGPKNLPCTASRSLA